MGLLTPGSSIHIVAWVLASSGAGCLHWHRDQNAPGVTTINTPPAHMASQRMEQPRDPGERMLVISPGLAFGGGKARHNNSDEGYFGIALEVTLDLGESNSSHVDQGRYDQKAVNKGGFLYPDQAIGVNLGVALADTERGSFRAGPLAGPVYLEIQGFIQGAGLAAGYQIDAIDGSHGPQGTAFLGPFFFRLAHTLDRSTVAQFGLMVKAPVGWVWSR
jgi:hypothetical protein